MHQNSLLTLQGAGAYDAAVHCASVSAARRIMSHRGDTPTHAGSSSRQPFDQQHHPNTPRAVRQQATATLTARQELNEEFTIIAKCLPEG